MVRLQEIEEFDPSKGEQQMNKQLLVKAALAGAVAAGSMTVGSLAFAKSAEKGLCSNASSCKGKGACGEAKAKNECKGQGSAKMTKAACEKMAKKDEGKTEHAWTAPEKKM